MPSPDRQLNRGDIFFPHVLSYRKTDRVVPIKYIAQLGPDNKSKAVFKGENSDGQLIVVKFTDRYNANGHRLLAEHGLAPQLLYISSENMDAGHFGYRVMVVMEFLAGQTAEDYQLVSSKRGSIWSDVSNDVKMAIETLHKADLVFGDLRTPNIIIVNGHAKLVDFDWCGREGQDRYPRDLNAGIEWPTVMLLAFRAQKAPAAPLPPPAPPVHFPLVVHPLKPLTPDFQTGASTSLLQFNFFVLKLETPTFAIISCLPLDLSCLIIRENYCRTPQGIRMTPSVYPKAF